MAGVELATAYYSLVPSMDGTAAAVRSQSGALSSVWSGIGDDAGRGVRGGLVGGIAGAGAALVGAVAVLGIGNLIGDAVRTGVDFAMDGVDIAADMAETRSAIEQVFGAEAAAMIDSWAASSATAMGQSSLEALDAAKTFGIFGQAAGLTGQDLVLFSTDLTGLAGDLASFHNTSPEEAITAIGAALRGESEPIRQYGVLLDDATLRARALALGIYDGNGSLTAQQRIMAAQAEIFAQSSTAQGDFARTSESLSNQQKILAANFENSKAALGEALLPAMTTLATLANTTLVPVLNQVIEQVGPLLASSLAEAVPAFADLLVAIAPMIPELVRLGTEVLPPLIQGLIAISPLLIDWATNTAAVITTLNDIISLLTGDISFTEFAGRVGALSGSFVEAAGVVGSFVGTTATHLIAFANNARTKIDEVIEFITSLPGRAVGALGDLGSLLIDSGASLIQGFIDGISGMLGAVGDAVGGVLDFAAGFFPHSPAERGPLSGSGWRAIGTAGEALFEQFAGGFNNTALTPTISAGISAATMRFDAAPASVASGGGQESGLGAPSSMVVRLLREQIEATLRSNVIPVGAVQGPLGASNVGTSTRGRA